MFKRWLHIGTILLVFCLLSPLIVAGIHYQQYGLVAATLAVWLLVILISVHDLLTKRGVAVDHERALSQEKTQQV